MKKENSLPSLPNLFLRAEGLVAFLSASFLYFHFWGDWSFYIVALILPDIGIAGFLGGTKVGSVIYNVTHTFAIPTALATWLLLSGVPYSNTLLLLALVWCAHIGMDRAFGFGLKYPTHFSDTHMQRV